MWELLSLIGFCIYGAHLWLGYREGQKEIKYFDDEVDNYKDEN
jgi:hypothetical protein